MMEAENVTAKVKVEYDFASKIGELIEEMRKADLNGLTIRITDISKATGNEDDWISHVDFYDHGRWTCIRIGPDMWLEQTNNEINFEIRKWLKKEE